MVRITAVLLAQEILTQRKSGLELLAVTPALVRWPLYWVAVFMIAYTLSGSSGATFVYFQF